MGRGKQGERAKAHPGEAVDELGKAGRRRRWRSTEMTAADEREREEKRGVGVLTVE